MDNTRLISAITLLKQVRSEMHDDVDARVTEGFDEAIAILEDALSNDGRPAKAQAALVRIGKALKYLPVIKALFEDLM